MYFNGKQQVKKKNPEVILYHAVRAVDEFESGVNYFLKEFVKKKSVLVSVLDSYLVV